MKDFTNRIKKYLEKVRPSISFDIVFDEQEEYEDDFWNRYTAFSEDEDCGDEGSFNRIGAILIDGAIHFGLNPISPVGFRPSYLQCVQAINMLQLPC